MEYLQKKGIEGEVQLEKEVFYFRCTEIVAPNSDVWQAV